MQINAVQGYNYQNAGLSKNNKQSFGHLKLGKTLSMQTIADGLYFSTDPQKFNSCVENFRKLHSVKININDLLRYVDDFRNVFYDKYLETLIKPFHKKYKTALFSDDEITKVYKEVHKKFFEAIGQGESNDYTLELENSFIVPYYGLRVINPDTIKCAEDIKVERNEITLPLSKDNSKQYTTLNISVTLPNDEERLLSAVKNAILDDLTVATRTLLEPLHVQRVNAAEEKIAKDRADYITNLDKEFRV